MKGFSNIPNIYSLSHSISDFNASWGTDCRRDLKAEAWHRWVGCEVVGRLEGLLLGLDELCYLLHYTRDLTVINVGVWERICKEGKAKNETQRRERAQRQTKTRDLERRQPRYTWSLELEP